MLPAKALENYEQLPAEAKQQVIDFIEFIKERYPQGQKNKTITSIEDSFGLLKTDRSVSLEEIDEAIKKQGGTL